MNLDKPPLVFIFHLMIPLSKRSIYYILLVSTLLTHSLSAKQALTVIPFELHGNHIFIKIKVNQSEPLDFIFDTGAAATLISQQKAKKLKLSSDGFVTIRNAKGPSIAYYSSNNTISFENDVKVDRIRISQLKLDHLNKALERRVDGIIGHDLLEHFVVLVNYDRSCIELYESETFSPTADYYAHSFDLIAGRPYIQASLILSNGETLKGRFQLDNGSGSSLTLYSSFVQKNNIYKKIGRTSIIYTMGFTGIIDKNYAGRLPAFDVGNFQVSNIPIRLNESCYFKKAFKDGVGHIGNGLLKRFNIAFDYKNKVSYWKPNQSFIREFAESYSGLVVKSDHHSEKILVQHVFANSPAFHAGLVKNDEIVMIDNIETAGRSSFEINDLLNTRNSSVEIVIKRNEKLQKMNLSLKTL